MDQIDIDDDNIYNFVKVVKNDVLKNTIPLENLRTTKYGDTLISREFLRNNSNVVSIKVVNLTRRPDRKEAMLTKFNNFGVDLKTVEFVEAIDGNQLKPNLEINELFFGNNYNDRRGFIGCALSHYYLWKRLLDDFEHDYYLIMEDDAQINSNFKEEIAAISSMISSTDFLFLGYLMYERVRRECAAIYDAPGPIKEIYPLDQDKYIGGFAGYYITKSGAKKMIDYISNNGITHGIDYLVKLVPGLRCYETRPHLVFADWAENGKKVDTNIQYDYNNLHVKSESFVSLQDLDQINCDLYFKKGNRKQLQMWALRDPNVVAVNSLGYFKSALVNLTRFRCTGQDLCTYVKKDYFYSKPDLPRIRVKVLGNWADTKSIVSEFSHMCEKDRYYYELELVDTEKADFYVIINYPRNGDYYEPDRTIIIQAEPWCGNEYQKWGVKTWGKWSDPDPDKFLSVNTTRNGLNLVQWQYKVDVSRLLKDHITKTKVISTICSSKYFDPGHKKRIDFLKYLENKDFKIDIYGFSNDHKFSQYRGNLEKKEEGYLSYKYYLIAENNSEPNYITEKLWEPILMECLVFYWGAPNVEDYLPEGSFIRLSLEDFEGDYQKMVEMIANGERDKRLSKIREAKSLILEKYGFMPKVREIIRTYKDSNGSRLTKNDHCFSTVFPGRFDISLEDKIISKKTKS